MISPIHIDEKTVETIKQKAFEIARAKIERKQRNLEKERAGNVIRPKFRDDLIEDIFKSALGVTLEREEHEKAYRKLHREAVLKAAADRKQV